MGITTSIEERWEELTQQALERLAPRLHQRLKAEAQEALQRHTEGSTIRYPVQLHARLVLKVSQGEKEAWNGDAKQKPLAKVLPFKPVQPPPQSLEQREAMLANLKELTQLMKQKAGMDARAGMKNYPTMNDRNHQETMAYLESIRYLPMQS